MSTSVKPTATDLAVYERLELVRAKYLPLPVDLPNVRAALLETAHAFLGIREVGKSNTGYWINKFHKDVGLVPGHEWCLMAIQYMFAWLSEMYGRPDMLPLNYAATQRFWVIAHDRRLTTTNPREMMPGDTMIYRNGNDPKGHAALIIKIDGLEYTTIEGNVGADWRDGGGMETRRQSFEQWGPIGVARKSGRWTRGAVRFDLLYANWAPCQMK